MSNNNEGVVMKNKWLALFFLALAVSIIVIDGTIVNVAIPVIMKDLKLNFTQVEWVTTIYALVFSALLITSGRIADSVGRKKMLITGIIVFVAGSIFASLSRGIEMMLFARFIQGIGGAIVLPTTLSAVNSTFFGKDRIIAFAVWGSVISGMAALGPLLGGYITTYFSWQWIFWINLPIGIVILVGSLIYVPETYGESLNKDFDFGGFLLSSISLAAIVYGLIEGKNFGWWYAKNSADAIFGISRIPIILGIGIVAMILFILLEKYLMRKGKSVLLDLSLFNLKSFSLGNIIICLVAIGEFGLLFVLPLFLQNIIGYTSLQAGAILAAMGVGAFVSGGLASEIGRRTSPVIVSSIGLFLESAGLAGFYFNISPTSSTEMIVFWLVVYGIGLGMASAQLTSTILVEVPSNKSGQGSAMQSTVRQIGSALGIAIIGTILVGFLNQDISGSLDNMKLPPKMQTAIETSVIDSAGASVSSLKAQNGMLRMFPDKQKYDIITNINDGFTKSSVKTIGVSSLVLFSGFVLTLALPKNVHKKEERAGL